MLKTSAAVFAAMLFVAGVTPIMPAAPAQAEPKLAIELCRDVLLPARPASNLGECLSYIAVAQNESDGEASHACDFLAENDPFTFELLFVSKSECIQAFGLRGHWK